MTTWRTTCPPCGAPRPNSTASSEVRPVGLEADRLGRPVPVDDPYFAKLIARGEVVVVDENFGIRITSVVDPRQRAKSLA